MRYTRKESWGRVSNWILTSCQPHRILSKRRERERRREKERRRERGMESERGEREKEEERERRRERERERERERGRKREREPNTLLIKARILKQWLGKRFRFSKRD